MRTIKRHATWSGVYLLAGLLPFVLGPQADAQYRPQPSAGASPADAFTVAPATPAAPDRIVRTDAEWRAMLHPAQYYVMRQHGTEPAWSGRYSRGRHKGTFLCVGCDAPLFSSNHKFESGTGWPSFYRPYAADTLETAWDYRGPEPRVEVSCRRCGSHLGHVFSDGPPPTGLRYCINSVVLKLVPPNATPRPPAADPAPTPIAEPTTESASATTAPESGTSGSTP